MSADKLVKASGEVSPATDFADAAIAAVEARSSCKKCGGCGYVSVPGELVDAVCGECYGLGIDEPTSEEINRMLFSPTGRWPPGGYTVRGESLSMVKSGVVMKMSVVECPVCGSKAMNDPQAQAYGACSGDCARKLADTTLIVNDKPVYCPASANINGFNRNCWLLRGHADAHKCVIDGIRVTWPRGVFASREVDE